jgi:hypothetical protein
VAGGPRREFSKHFDDLKAPKQKNKTTQKKPGDSSFLFSFSFCSQMKKEHMFAQLTAIEQREFLKLR